MTSLAMIVELPTGRPAGPPCDADVLALVPDAVLVVDDLGTVLAAHGATFEVFGQPPEEAVGVNAFERVHPDDLAYAAGALGEARRRDGGHTPIELRVRHVDGSWVDVEVAGTTGVTGAGPALVLSLRPLARRGVAAARRRQLEHRAREITSSLAAARDDDQVGLVIAEAVAFVDVFYGTSACRLALPDGRAVDHGAPQEWPAPGGRSPQGFVDHGRRLGRRVFEVPIPSDEQIAWWLAWDADDPGANGWDDAHLSELVMIGVVAGAVDARMRLEADAERRARHDPLTGLANRAELERVLALSLERAGEHPVAVLFCDLDGFKAVNDAHGHAVGDQVLAAAALRLASALRPGDLLGRVGGDEFVAVCTGMDEPAAAGAGGRLGDAIASLTDVGGHAVHLGVSVGLAVGRQGDQPATLLACADQRMYEAKAGRRSHGGRHAAC